MATFEKRLKEINSTIGKLMDEIDEIQATTEAEIKMKAASEEKLSTVSMLLRNMHFNMFFLNKMKAKQSERVG